MKKILLFISMLFCSVWMMAQDLSQTISWEGLSLRYPSSYRITDKEMDEDGNSFCCSIRDRDKISEMTVGFFSHPSVSAATYEEQLMICEQMMETVIEQTTAEFSDVRFGKVNEEKGLESPRVSRSFSATFSDIPLSGQVVVFTEGETQVLLILLAENKFYLKTLQSIANSIELY